MTGMILAKSMGAALAVAVMAGSAGEASAGLREYCDSYARDVAHRKINGGADVLVGTIGGALSGALIGGGGVAIGATGFIGAGNSSVIHQPFLFSLVFACVSSCVVLMLWKCYRSPRRVVPMMAVLTIAAFVGAAYSGIVINVNIAFQELRKK